MDRRILQQGLRALAVASLALAPLAARPTTLTILHVNDTHSHLEGLGPPSAGGLEKAATIVAGARASTPDTLFVHAGDLFQGDVFFNATYGVAELQLLSRLGLDAMAVGNHEFHLGPQVLLGALAQAYPEGGSPLLSANLDLAGVPALGAFVKPRMVKEVGGVRVGIFGLTTPFDLAAAPDPVAIESDLAKVVAIAAAQAQALRSEGAAVVLCLSHMGFQIDQLLAAQVPGLDAIIGGHDHLLLAAPVLVPGPGGKEVPIVQAGAFYEWVGKLTLTVDAGGVSVAGYELLAVDAGVAPFAPFAPVLAKVQRAAGALFPDLQAHVATAPFDVAPAPAPGACARDTGAGDLVTDAMRARTGTELAFTVNGLMAAGLARGAVTGQDLFRMVGDGFDPSAVAAGQPFGSSPLFTLDITGAHLFRAIETTLAVGGDVALQASGLTYRFDSTRPPFARVLAIEVGGAPLDPARVYRATVNFGVLQGLPKLGVTIANVQPAGSDEYGAVLDLAKRLRTLAYAPQGRAQDVATPCP